jgi:hypothetical protein
MIGLYILLPGAIIMKKQGRKFSQSKLLSSIFSGGFKVLSSPLKKMQRSISARYYQRRLNSIFIVIMLLTNVTGTVQASAAVSPADNQPVQEQQDFGTLIGERFTKIGEQLSQQQEEAPAPTLVVGVESTPTWGAAAIQGNQPALKDSKEAPARSSKITELSESKSIQSVKEFIENQASNSSKDIPLAFIQNMGQFDKQALFQVKASGATCILRKTQSGLHIWNIRKQPTRKTRKHLTIRSLMNPLNSQEKG